MATALIMPCLPLISQPPAHRPIAWNGSGAVSRERFLDEVGELVARLPAGAHLLNLCRDRYRFSVGLAAAIVAGKLTLLPPAHTPQVVRELKAVYPDLFCLTDGERPGLDLPQLRYPVIDPAGHRPAGSERPIPQIARQQPVAVLFTSGSTGAPQAHPKTWEALVGSAQAGTARLLALHGEVCTLIGTVPPQHMYGLETTVLMAWQSGNALAHDQPFYPADIARALAAVPAPRVLVSTPVHLRALIESGLSLPPLAGVISATAPLSADLAQQVEARCQAPLLEIYGSTETGMMASRRPALGAPWQWLPGIGLSHGESGPCVAGAHIGTPTPLNDRIEPLADDRFLLHGRLADLVNIAGKRHSLASLNHLLKAIPGVQDGVFYLPDDSEQRVTRLAACVVAPGMTAPRLLAALRQTIDPVFLPRPLRFVDRLPRNESGKLTRSALQALFASDRPKDAR